ncbi:MAG: hypothetical protein RBS30_07125, partial [Sphaerochaetaceae bacterium]|nr:hypothetical protein [Sphaerochaetaceae bacterium]
PNYEFLSYKHGIHDGNELKKALDARLAETDLLVKQKDVQHLLFDVKKSNMITNFDSFISELVL